MLKAKPPHEILIDGVIAEAFSQLDVYPSNSNEYAQIVRQIETLYALKNNRSSRVSPDTLFIVLGNLLGIAIIVGHERANVVTSKALNFVMKASR